MLDRDARRGQVHAGFLDTARDGKRPQPFAAIAPVAGEPGAAFFQYLAYPVQGFKVVLQRGAAKQAHLRHIGRPQARHAAFAFNRLDHGRLFATNVGTSATAQFDVGQVWNGGFQLGQFGFQDGAAAVVFVAQVDVDFGNADRPSGNQHAFQKTVRVALQVNTVLEGARLAFIDVDRHQAWCDLGAHDAPFAPRRKTGTTQAAQARVFHGFEHGFKVFAAIHTLLEQGVTACGLVGRQAGVGLCRVPDRLGVCRCRHTLQSGMGHGVLTHHRHGCLLAAAHARCRNHAHGAAILAQNGGQLLQQVLCTCHLARETITHPNRQACGGCFTFFHDVKVVVETGHFKNLGLGQAHFLGQRRQVLRRQMPISILNFVQVFNQQIGPARRIAQKLLHLGQGCGIHAAAFGAFAFAGACGICRLCRLCLLCRMQSDDGNNFSCHAEPKNAVTVVNTRERLSRPGYLIPRIFAVDCQQILQPSLKLLLLRARR